MSKIGKLFISLTATFALLTSGATAASAAPAPLSLSEFQLSSGYQAIIDSAQATQAYLATKNFVKVTSNVKTSLGGNEIMSTNVVMLSTRTESAVSMQLSSGGVAAGTAMNFGFTGGQFYSDLPEDMDANFKAALVRLKKTGAKYLSVPSSEIPTDLGGISPTDIFSGTKSGALSSLDGVLTNCTFEAIVSSANPEDATLTDLTFTAVIPPVGILPEIPIRITQTMDANKVFVKQTAVTTMNTMEVAVTTVFEYPETLTMPVINSANMVKIVDIDAMRGKMTAEKALLPKAKALTNKALALAKSAKKTLAVSHLTAAAKALKYVVTAIKNGVKLTTKVSGWQGSVCVTVVKAKAVTATC